MKSKCAQMIIEELPKVACYLRQNFCSSEIQGLTMQQHRLMSILLDGDQSISSLAKDLGVSLPAVSRMIKQLDKCGWVKKEEDKHDSRTLKLSITAVGRKMIKESRSHAIAGLEPKLSQLSASQRQTLIEACQILNNLTKIES